MAKKINKKSVSTARLSAYISQDLSDRLDMYSERWGVSKSALVSTALGQYFDALEKGYDFGFKMLEDLVKGSFSDEQKALIAKNVNVMFDK